MDQQTKKNIVAFLKQKGLMLRGGGGDILLLARGGSDRNFYRVETGNGSFVVMTAPSFCYEIRAYLDVGAYLFKCGVAVPEIIAYDDMRQLVLLEDLGDLSLYAQLQQAKTRQEVAGHYREVLAFLAGMQLKATSAIGTCTYLKHRCFGYEALRWETDYFLECFVGRLCGITGFNERALEEELHGLASSITNEPKYFMHRDFQSRNIYFKNGRVRVIDFQTATQGLLQYDLASLLKDAYFILGSNEINDLVLFYIAALEKETGRQVNRDSFVAMFHCAGLQRNMQALGAFAFLSMNKGKTEFLQHIPAALSCLREGLSFTHELPVLKDIVEQSGHKVLAEKVLEKISAEQ
ncbi:MAG: phosphotransferase [Pseudomonadota bacterium]